MRTFVALEVGGPGDPGRPGRATAPDHLTLQFLGEVPEDRIGAISTALRAAVASQPPFDLTLEGVGAFPSIRSPRVVWVGTTVGRDAAVRLARAVSEALEPLGFPAERGEFVPHVTLFRVRSPRDRARAEQLLTGAEPAPPPRVVRVAEVLLKASELRPEGAVHRTLERFPLAGSLPPAGQPVERSR